MSPDPLVLICLFLSHLPWSLCLAYIDVKEHRLPNRLVAYQTLSVVATCGLLTLTGQIERTQMLSALVVATVIGVAGILFALAFPGLIGMGDMKILPVTVLTCLVLGGVVLPLALIWLGSVATLCALITLIRSRHLSSRFALGPAIVSAPYGGLLLAAALPASIQV